MEPQTHPGGGGRATRAAGGNVTLVDLADYPLPLYDGDLEQRDGLPDNALGLKALFKEHDAFLGESGLVPYQNKVAAILAASPGIFGGMRMLPHLRQLLNTLGVLVLPGQFSLAHADQAFDEENGALKSPARLRALVVELLSTARALARPPN